MAENKDYINSFIEAQENYLENKDENSWHIMFISCQKMCEITLANYARKNNFRVDKEVFADISSEAAVRIMNRYKKAKGYKIEYLRTICRYSIIDVMYNKRNKFEDSVECCGLDVYFDEDASFSEIEVEYE